MIHGYKYFFFHHETPSICDLAKFCIIFHPFNDDGKTFDWIFSPPPWKQKVIIESDDSPPFLLWKFYFCPSNEKWSSKANDRHWSFLFELHRVTFIIMPIFQRYHNDYYNHTFNTREITFVNVFSLIMDNIRRRSKIGNCNTCSGKSRLFACRLIT